MLFQTPKLLGIVFDLTLRRLGNRRLVDLVKKSVQAFVNSYEDEEEDGLYVYAPENEKVLYGSGRQTAALGNYQTDGFKFNLENALRQTMYIIGSRPESRKVVCLITDRIGPREAAVLPWVSVLNAKDDMDCRFLVIGLGRGYARLAVEEACFGTVSHVHADDPSMIPKILTDFFEHP